MVNEMRVPSSSSSSSTWRVSCQLDRIESDGGVRVAAARTNSVGLDLDTVLNVSASWVVGVLVSEDGLSA